MKIRCVACRELIYDCTVVGSGFSGDPVHAGHFVPLDPKDRAPEDGKVMNCPRCGALFASRAGTAPGKAGIVLLLEDESWWPHPPIE